MTKKENLYEQPFGGVFEEVLETGKPVELYRVFDEVMHSGQPAELYVVFNQVLDNVAGRIPKADRDAETQAALANFKAQMRPKP